MTVEESVTALRAEVSELRADLRRPERLALTYEHAAMALDVSISTVRRMVRSNLLLTVELGTKKMVPASEIRRVTTPKPATVHQLRARKTEPYSAAKEAELARASKLRR